MSKKLAIYGTYETKTKITYKQRYWHKRKDGIRQRYWQKTTRTKTVTKTGRYEFTGKGKDLYEAVKKAHQIMPKGYITTSAEKFLENPEKYGIEGEWIEKEIEY